MDLGKLTTSESATLVLLHPQTNLPLGGEKTQITIELAGIDSETYRNAKHKTANKRMERAQRMAGKYKLSAEELEEEQLQLLADCTIGWKNIELNGKPLEFSIPNAKKLYADFPWIRQQVDTFTGDRGNFFGS